MLYVVAASPLSTTTDLGLRNDSAPASTETRIGVRSASVANTTRYLHVIQRRKSLDVAAAPKFNVTWKEFHDAITKNQFPPPKITQYLEFRKGLVIYGQMESKREIAMFLAQILHESGGLQYKEEIRCAENPKNCAKDYVDPLKDIKGKQYFGRGYIQLTWAMNYEAASKDLYGDGRLLKDPDLVAKNEGISWGVSFWYWHKRVRNHPGIPRGEFGTSTALINGALECNGRASTAALNRFRIYSQILKIFGINEKPNPLGCKKLVRREMVKQLAFSPIRH